MPLLRHYQIQQSHHDSNLLQIPAYLNLKTFLMNLGNYAPMHSHQWLPYRYCEFYPVLKRSLPHNLSSFLLMMQDIDAHQD